MNPVLTPPISSYRCSSHLSRVSCVKCGARPSAPDVAELIETNELCPKCRAADLRDSAKEIHDAVADLVRDSLPAMSRGLLSVELEEMVVAYATILAPVGVKVDAATATAIALHTGKTIL